MSEDPRLPLIVDVKRGSLEDGPGMRSVVFFKGCPLRCVFCHNPEAQDVMGEIAFSRRDCIECGQCQAVCPKGAIDLASPERIDRSRCDRCGACAEVCPGGGIRAVGSFHEPEALAELLLRDLPFYRHSGGGVTFSGGECTLYPGYLEAALQPLKRAGVHVILETCGYFDHESIERAVLPYVDLIFFDIKLADEAEHVRWTGRSNRLIFENLRRLLAEGRVEVLPRVPLIPGITATEANLSAIIRLLCGAGAKQVSFLPYNPLGLQMYRKLGREQPLLLERFMTPAEEEALRGTVRSLIAAAAPARDDIKIKEEGS